MAKHKRQAMPAYPLGNSLSLPWMYTTRPTFCSGVASLWQGLTDILSPQFIELPQAYFRTNDAAVLASDVQAVLNDARRAHQQLLLTYPRLMN
jgi:hypothetical protein